MGARNASKFEKWAQAEHKLNKQKPFRDKDFFFFFAYKEFSVQQKMCVLTLTVFISVIWRGVL